MPQVVPAILEEAFEVFKDKSLRIVKLPGVQCIHVDFGDGQFMDRKLLGVGAIDSLNPAFHWEAHLMVKEPKDFFDYKIAGFSTVLVHYEAYDNSRDLHEAVEKIKGEGLIPGLVINAGTPVEVFKDFAKSVEHFMLMGVRVGYQGQAFIPETLERIAALRKLIPNAIIEVDGGVNETNIKSIAQAGADLIVVGAAIVKAPDMLVAWEKLNAEINRN